MMMLMGHNGYEAGRFSRAFCDAAGSCIAAGTSDIQILNIFNSMERSYGICPDAWLPPRSSGNQMFLGEEVFAP